MAESRKAGHAATAGTAKSRVATCEVITVPAGMVSASKQPLPALIFPSSQQDQEQQAFKIAGAHNFFPLHALFLLLPVLLPLYTHSSSTAYSPVKYTCKVFTV